MAVIDTLVQSSTDSTDSDSAASRIVRDSAGRLYAGFIHTNIVIAYSDDSGLTWSSEYNSGIASATHAVFAIDSADKIHVAYRNSSGVPTYTSFSGLAWGGTEQIDSGTTDPAEGMDMAIDSADNVHVVWSSSASPAHLMYGKRTSGVWGSAVDLYTAFDEWAFPRIVIDSLDRITIISTFESANTQLYAFRYESGAWSGPVSVDTSSTIEDLGDVTCGIAVDSSDNVHVVWRSDVDTLRYNKYTSSTSLWGTDTLISTTGAVDGGVSMAVDASNNLHVVWQSDTPVAGNAVAYIKYSSGAWGSDSYIVNFSSPNSVRLPQTRSCVWPVIGGVHTMIPTSGIHFNYGNSNGDQFRYYASADIDFPAPQDKNYTREAISSVSVTDSNLATIFTSTGYSNILITDSIFEDQAATNQYAVQLFKNKGNLSSDSIIVSWTGKASVAPSSSTVYLQIYNRNSSTWETLDSNSVQSANSVFTLAGSKTTSLSNYYDGNKWVSCRVYQLAV